MDINDIATQVSQFAKERNWQNNNPNELLVALYTELGELGEHFLWMKEFPTDLSDEKRKEIGYEIVDVLIYLLQVAKKIGIDDVSGMYLDKREKLAKKFPVGLSDAEHAKIREEYKKTGKNKFYE
jgi:NTP pyrophosphatase (non-canonical NTP hydrolase)